MSKLDFVKIGFSQDADFHIARESDQVCLIIQGTQDGCADLCLCNIKRSTARDIVQGHYGYKIPRLPDGAADVEMRPADHFTPDLRVILTTSY